MTVTVGTPLPERTIGPIDIAAMKQVALFLDDPNPIHFDGDAVRAMGLGERPINQGPNGIGYLLNLLVEFAGAPERVRRLQCRLHANVFEGDVLIAGGTVSAMDDGVAHCEVWLKRDGDVVISGGADVELAPNGGKP